MNKVRLLAVATAVLLSSASFAQSSKLPTAGSDERRENCDQFAGVLDGYYGDLSNGVSIETIGKEIQIELAGSDNQVLAAVVATGLLITEYYVLENRSRRELNTDFMYECVTTDVYFDAVIDSWANSVLPESHELRKPAAVASNALTPGQYYEVFGDALTGTQAMNAYARREDGIVTGCGLEFSHVFYDQIYHMGQPVKISGSLNLMEHPVQILASLLKIKAELITVWMESEPRLSHDVQKISDAYMLADDQPLLNNNENFQCDDPEYFCHIAFQWSEAAEAIVNNT